LLAYYII